MSYKEKAEEMFQKRFDEAVTGHIERLMYELAKHNDSIKFAFDKIDKIISDLDMATLETHRIGNDYGQRELVVVRK